MLQPKFKPFDFIVSPEGLAYRIINICYDPMYDTYKYLCTDGTDYKVSFFEYQIKSKEEYTMIPHYDWQIKMKEEEKQMATKHHPHNQRIIEIAKQLIETIQDMNTTCEKAGGSGFSIPELEKMTALDLLCTFASNNIRFEHVKQ